LQCKANGSPVIGDLFATGNYGSFTIDTKTLECGGETESYLNCANPNCHADNHCNMENNNPACNYDGGDCCGAGVICSINTYFPGRSTCECKDPSARDGCEFPNWKGDGWCDDGNNNPGCDFDGVTAVVRM